MSHAYVKVHVLTAVTATSMIECTAHYSTLYTTWFVPHRKMEEEQFCYQNLVQIMLSMSHNFAQSARLLEGQGCNLYTLYIYVCMYVSVTYYMYK